MIQSVIAVMTTHLQSGLPGIKIEQGLPGQPERPSIWLLAGRFEVSQNVKDISTGQPRPQAHRDQLTADHANLSSPYPLSHIPLLGSARGTAVWGAGTLLEEQVNLEEGEDFSINYRQGEVAFTDNLLNRLAQRVKRLEEQIYAQAGRPFNLNSPQQLSAVLFDELKLPPPGPPNQAGYYSTATSSLQPLAGQYPIIDLILAYRTWSKLPTTAVFLSYSFVGVFTIREFKQELWVTIYGESVATVERLASLTINIILTNYDALLKACNGPSQNEYRQNEYTTTHIIDQLQLLEGVTAYTEQRWQTQLKFQVGGQLKLMRERTDGFGIIEQILSPGKISNKPGVDIEIST